jgi:hypothetical protein
MKTNNPAMFSTIREGINRAVRNGERELMKAMSKDTPKSAPDAEAPSEKKEGFME